ncbi:MAG TPA: LysR substrate-binding domain-containing protein [Solirubrobacteraceae bacterium]|jgi:DNA-binding transcriptional LysR family regulator
MDRLDLRLVEYFVAVAEELHFGHAAERLHIAQPSLSQQIRRLEQQLGVSLLERNSRNVRLTRAGEAFLREGRRALAQAQRAISATRAAGAELLTVGFYGSAGRALLPPVLTAFHERQPMTEVTVREILFGSIDEILDGKVDVAFTRLLPEQTELEVQIIATEPRLIALASTHPLAHRETLTFADLRGESFIVNPMVSHGGLPARWLAEQRRHGLAGQVAAEARSPQEIMALVGAGRGVCLVPAAGALHDRRPDVVYVPVTDAEPAVVSLAWPPERSSPTIKALVATAREVAGTSADPDPSPMSQSGVQAKQNST